ncbi:MAG TPA: hypothetical protein VK900_16550 [Anaerolineales bacterium]|nr:hypothetical protein [Anaerolineales bacterium]
MNSNVVRNLAWVYAIMFFFLGSLAHIPWINDEHGMTLGIFSLQWYDDLLHYGSGLWAAIAAWRSFKDSVFYFKLFGAIYALDGVMGFFLGQGYLDGGIFLQGITPLDLSTRFLANIPHILIGGIAMYIGFVMSRRVAQYAPA